MGIRLNPDVFATPDYDGERTFVMVVRAVLPGGEEVTGRHNIRVRSAPNL
jgi:hypothetical protein